jgi:folate-binding protein YgfZ
MSTAPILADVVPSRFQALENGRGALGLEGFRAVAVRGADAERFLQDLLTADLGRSEPGRATRSLLLGPTGRIRADLHVLRDAEGFLLLQSLDQPTSVASLLAPYVLSSDVRLEEVPPPPLLAVPAAGPWRFVPADAPGLVRVSAEDVESWRIRRGLARFPVDLDEDSLPAEAGLDDGEVIDRRKGCYLGQESVAKVRNLGHPTRVVLALRAESPVRPGEAVLARGEDVGVVTSADALGGPGIAALARVRWEARDEDLATASGTRLLRP